MLHAAITQLKCHIRFTFPSSAERAGKQQGVWIRTARTVITCDLQPWSSGAMLTTTWPHVKCDTEISLLFPIIYVLNMSSQTGTTSGTSLQGRRYSSMTKTLVITSTDQNLLALLYHSAAVHNPSVVFLVYQTFPWSREK